MSLLKLLGWTATILVLWLLVWQTAVDEPLWPRTLSGLLMVLISGMAGLRMGSDGSAAYIQDLQRTNKVLADQQRELEEMNANLLRQVSAESQTPAPSKSA
jgi:hypothetical protein